MTANCALCKDCWYWYKESSARTIYPPDGTETGRCGRVPTAVPRPASAATCIYFNTPLHAERDSE